MLSSRIGKVNIRIHYLKSQHKEITKIHLTYSITPRNFVSTDFLRLSRREKSCVWFFSLKGEEMLTSFHDVGYVLES